MANAGMSGFVSFLDVPAPVQPAREVEKPATQPAGESATVLKPNTVKEIDTVQGDKVDTVQISDTAKPTDTVQESITVQPREARRWRVKRTRAVEDGHSLAEQEVYRTLWRVGVPEGEDPNASRTIRIGYDRLAALVRLSWVTVKANLRSLEKKLAIEVLAAEDSANREGKQYRVYSSPAIWERRQLAGLLWVRRSRGVELLTDAGNAGVAQNPEVQHRTGK